MSGEAIPAYRRGLRARGELPVGPSAIAPGGPVGLTLTVNVNVFDALRQVFATGTVPDEVLDKLYELVRNEMLKRESTRRGV